MGTFVLVHGAWHTGDCYDDVSKFLRRAGHKVHAPTLAGNRPGDSKTTTLEQAIQSLVAHFQEHKIKDAVLLGHSYGGMVITGAADRLPEGTIKRLIYWSAYVPNNGESLEDISPPLVASMHETARQPDGSLVIPYGYWREALMNDAQDETVAKRYFSRLTPQSHNTLRDKISLKTNPADMKVGKSYIHCWDDVCYPKSHGGWHPLFSEKLGLCRLVSMPGGHEVCFTNPELLAQNIIKAGND
jgi:pimeloyl-ACP methyl ester carboxylesterase